MGLSRRDLLRMGLCAGAGLVSGPPRLLAQQAGASHSVSPAVSPGVNAAMSPGMKMGPASQAGA
ncbi:MAG: hypothetical protein WA604_07280, partial [Candidatus Sulfotelmatobacter sp.]